MTSSLDSLSADALASLACMEGTYEPIVETRAVEVKPSVWSERWPGYLLAGVIAALAYGLKVWVPISAAILAIAIGLLARNLLPLPGSIVAGCNRIIKRIIPIAIVLTGAGLNLKHIAEIGFAAFFIIVLSMTVAITAAYYLGRSLGLGHRVAMLIGAGTGICGNSAIVAVAPLIEAEDEDLVLSIGTVNLFGLAAMLACPLLAGVLGLEHEAFGVWAGTSIHAVPQVVAAGFAHSEAAGTLATLVKLVRVAMLAPLVFVLALIYVRHHATPEQGGRRFIVHYARLVPWFVWGFVFMATMSTLGLIPTLQFEPIEFLSSQATAISLQNTLTGTGKLLLTLAMAAIGLEVNIRLLAGVSGLALVTGLLTTLVLMAVSFGLIHLLLLT